MASRFLIQVVDKTTGDVVSWAPGLAAERQFTDDLVNRVVAKGVGYGRSSAKVGTAVRESLTELLHDLKRDVPPGH